MSIFKQTFKEHIQKQIENRQDLLASETRKVDFQKYVSGKSPWVKMTSMVDFDNSIDLAKNYILFGGTLQPDTKDKTNQSFRLRSGISVPGASYGSVLGSNEYGIRPMPGITSVSVKSRGAYGSLKDTTIKYYAWDLKQLENLSILYMKPGYPVLVEWGWSMYLDGKSNIVNSDFKTIDCFAPGINIESIYKTLQDLNKTSCGNYEGSLGLIKNFEYSLMPNGGYECTTVLVSIGEVISSLKMNVETNAKIDVSTAAATAETTATGSSFIKDEFEVLMDAYCNYTNQLPNTYINSLQANSVNIPGVDVNILTFGDQSRSTTNPDIDSRYTRFIQLAYFINILNEKHNIFLTGDQKLLNIEIPIPYISSNYGNGLCVASYNSVTIDNNVCIIQNQEAKLFDKDYGFSPHIENSTAKIQNQTTNNYSSPNLTPVANNMAMQSGQVRIEKMQEYLAPGTNLGIIGNIYLNIGNLIDLYKQTHKANQGKVSYIPFIKRVLEDVQYALGSVNSFDVFSTDNRVVIIDKHYVELPSDSSYDNKFKINILGTNSIVREHKVVSRIFEEQSTMIAIAAQNRENIGSMQTSTNVFLNKRAYNRLYKNSDFSKTNVEEEDATTREKDRRLYVENLIKLIDYVNMYIVPGVEPRNKTNVQSTLNTYLNTLVVKLEKGTDYKGILPLSLEVKIDGIGGIIIGEIFKINKEILPSEYGSKKIGFIVVGIDEEISRADWTTSIRAQFCLLDQLERQKEAKTESDKIFKDIAAVKQSLIGEIKKSIGYRNLLIGFIHDFFADMLGLQNLKDLYYIDNKQPKIFKVFGQDLKDHFFPNPSSYQAKTDFTKNDLVEISLHRYLNTFLDANQSRIGERATQDDYEDNIVRYLTSAVKNSYFYNAITNTEIKNIFDTEFDLIINAYKSKPTKLGKAGAVISLVAEVAIETISGGILDYQNSISQNIDYLGSDKIKLHNLNTSAYTESGQLDKDKLILKDSIVTITFDDNFRAKKPLQMNGDN